MTERRLPSFLAERRLPWVLASRLVRNRNRTRYALNRATHALRSHRSPRVGVNCGFQGLSGGATATADIASGLATCFEVSFESCPTSHYNSMVSSQVRLVPELDADADLYLCDVSCDHGFMKRVKDAARPLVVCSHGLPSQLHELDDARVTRSLDLADHTVFVSEVQRAAFGRSADTCSVIPNAVVPVRKRHRSNDVGCVGNLTESRKNVDASIAIARLSGAERIHLWGAGTDRWRDPAVVVHPWERDRDRIYDSFDCLVFMSELETFGLVVIEAMSAGVPCVLNDIPVFRQFADCPGVRLVPARDTRDAALLVDELLERRDELRPHILRHFGERFGREIANCRWRELVERLLADAP